MDAALWASELMQGVLPDALRKLLWQDVQPLAELIITVDGYDYGRLGRSRRGIISSEVYLLSTSIFLPIMNFLHSLRGERPQPTCWIVFTSCTSYASRASNVSQVNSLQRAGRERLEWHMSLTIDSGATGSFVNGEPGSSTTESSSPRPRQRGRPRGSRQTARPTTPQIGRIYLPSGRERLTRGALRLQAAAPNGFDSAASERVDNT
mmetsp:Transcript_29527/g.60477  ORF Transcript_29527/g.60477 Transcript_29527/m.60477 type:complete len:207 (-) Transcript_29527:1284-1904(-)